ncbi:MAG: RICIN domain-containing protein [Acidobacteria bacterium]|nr:RICIN domain-containing protein [Acidobacteriota bacterium]
MRSRSSIHGDKPPGAQRFETKSRLVCCVVATMAAAVMVGRAAPPAINIVSGLIGLCLNVDSPPGVASDRPEGTVVGTMFCTSNANQKFRLTTSGEIRVFTNKCLDDPGGRGGNGDRIVIRRCTGQRSQQWTPSTSGEVKSFNGRCLDIQDKWVLPGGAAILWDCNGGDSQKWGALLPGGASASRFSLQGNLPDRISRIVSSQGGPASPLNGAQPFLNVTPFTMAIGNNLSAQIYALASLVK